MKSGKNNISKLPNKVSSQQEAEEFIGLCALLETKSPAPKKDKHTYFSKATHLFTKVVSWSQNEGWKLKPLNSFGEEDGVAKAELPANVSVLPAVDRVIDFGGQCGLRNM